MALAGLESGKYSTCAVVGSAGHLLHGEHGEHIDAHDVVVRFNTVPVGGKLAKNVGARTTMRFLNPRRALELCKHWCEDIDALAQPEARARAVRGVRKFPPFRPPPDPLQTPSRLPPDISPRIQYVEYGACSWESRVLTTLLGSEAYGRLHLTDTSPPTPI
eukprot:876670-Prorocentrum_minimum.AAC.1